MVTNDEQKSRTWGMVCHLAALLGFVGVPFGHLLGPLVVWLIFRKEHPFVDEQGKEVLNFQITMTLYGLVAALLVVVLIGVGLLLIVAVADVVLIIMAAIKINNGESFKYPLTLRIIK